MANNRLPFGLCKKYGVDLPENATPRDAWAALDKIPTEEFKKPLKVPMDFFASKKTSQIRTYHSDEKPDLPKEAFKFARLNTEHHIKHAQDMGYKNQKEYERAAVIFWNNSEGDMYYSSARDSFYKYYDKTNEMLVISPEGIIHTFLFRTKKEFMINIRWDKLEKI